MLSRILAHPFWSGISGVLGVVALGFTVYTVYKDSSTIQLPTDYSERKILNVSLLAPSEWVVQKGLIENWGYIHPIDKELYNDDLSNLSYPFIYVISLRLTEKEFDEKAYPDESLKGYNSISMVPEVLANELGVAERYRFEKGNAIIERLHIPDYYHSKGIGEEYNHQKTLIDCVIPKGEKEVFSKMCSKIIGSVKYHHDDD